jgi:hypothetical protein
MQSHSKIRFTGLGVGLCALLAAAAHAQTPAPALQTPFSLPLTDKTTAQAVLLPTLNGQAFLVYATPTGRLGLWTMSPTTPTPPPEPQPQPPPQPPNVLPPLPDWIIPGNARQDRTCKGRCRWK